MKKILLFIAAVWLGSTVIQAQTPDEVFTIAEQMPEYPGGEKAMSDFLSKNITYPKTAYKDKVQGKVWIEFVVDKEGNVTNVQVIRGVATELDEEAVRVVKLMPKWKPGMQKGKPVNVKFRLPINFTIY